MNQRKAGILLSYVSMGVNAVVMLLYVPMMLHYLTKAQYGVYQLMGSFLAALSLMDFGLCNGVTRFLAQAQAREDKAQQTQILLAAKWLYTLVAVGIVLVGAVLYASISPLYGATLSPQELVWAKQVFVVLLINMMIIIMGNLFVAVLFAREEFTFWQVLVLIGLITAPLLIWGVLHWKANILYVACAQTLVNTAVYIGAYLYCKTRLQVHFAWGKIPWEWMRRIVQFSGAVFVGNVAGQIYWRLGGFVLGAVIGAVAVANYYIATQICLFFIMLSSSVGNVFLPKLSADAVKSDSLQSHNEIFCQTGRLQGMIALLICVGFFLLGREFLRLWLGPGNEVCFWPALILMAGYTLSVMQSVAAVALQAINRYAGFATISLATAVLNILLTIPLSKWYGVTGSAVSAAFCLLVVQGIAANLYYNRVGLKVGPFVRQVAPVVGSALAVLAGLCLLWRVWPVAHTWVSFVTHGVVIVGVYAAVMAAFVLNQFEWDLVRECWQFIRSGGRSGIGNSN